MECYGSCTCCTSNKKLVYIDESSGADVFLYPEKLMNLYSLSFSIGIFILLVYITGRIIDKN